MSSRPILLAALVILPFIFGACTEIPARWDKAGIEDDERDADARACRDFTRNRMNSREIRESEGFHGRALDAAETNRNDDLAGVRRIMEADQHRLRQRFFGDCMLDRGYRRASN